MGKVCHICGEPSGMFPLCKKHNELKEKGLVFKNEKTGQWEIKQEDKEITAKLGNCIICGKETQQEYLFCKEHFNEYHNKTILIRITNCKQFEFVDTLDKYETGLTYVCKDGHRVRSKSEVAIDNYLYDHDIKHAYEKAYPIDNNPENDLHPDFYLSDLDLYIEHWGYSNKSNYNETREYKTKIYNQNKTTVIGTEEEDIKDIETSLTRKLKFYTKGKVN